jgi:hypothetical protein
MFCVALVALLWRRASRGSGSPALAEDACRRTMQTTAALGRTVFPRRRSPSCSRTSRVQRPCSCALATRRTRRSWQTTTE